MLFKRLMWIFLIITFAVHIVFLFNPLRILSILQNIINSTVMWTFKLLSLNMRNIFLPYQLSNRSKWIILFYIIHKRLRCYFVSLNERHLDLTYNTQINIIIKINTNLILLISILKNMYLFQIIITWIVNEFYWNLKIIEFSVFHFESLELEYLLW